MCEKTNSISLFFNRNYPIIFFQSFSPHIILCIPQEQHMFLLEFSVSCVHFFVLIIMNSIIIVLFCLIGFY